MSDRAQVVLLAALVSCLLAAGQVLLKQVLAACATQTLLSLVSHAAGEARFWLALACTGGAALLWMKVLASSSLSWAYPLISLSYGVVVIAGALFLGERVTMHGWVGLFFIVLGVGLVALGEPH